MSQTYLTDRKYTKDHEWAKTEANGTLRVGITDFAVSQLGDITLVTLDVKPGAVIKAGQVFGTIESVKTLSDLYAPLSGTVKAINTNLDASPELVNEDCYGKAWMIELAPEGESSELLSAEAYAAHVGSLG